MSHEPAKLKAGQWYSISLISENGDTNIYINEVEEVAAAVDAAVEEQKQLGQLAYDQWQIERAKLRSEVETYKGLYEDEKQVYAASVKTENELTLDVAVWLKENAKLRAKLAEAKLILNRAAGYKVDRCACVFDWNDTPVTECNYHSDLKAERDAEVERLNGDIATLKSTLRHDEESQKEWAKRDRERVDDLIRTARERDDARDEIAKLRAKLAESEKLITSIKAAIQEKYYDALDQRKHGGLAADEAFTEIQRLLGMSWQKAGG